MSLKFNEIIIDIDISDVQEEMAVRAFDRAKEASDEANVWKKPDTSNESLNSNVKGLGILCAKLYWFSANRHIQIILTATIF